MWSSLSKRGKNVHSERYCLTCDKVRTFKYKFKEKHSLCSYCKGWKCTRTKGLAMIPNKELHFASTKSLQDLAKNIGVELHERRLK